VKKILQEALALHNSRDFLRAQVLYEKILDLDSQNFEALQLLGVLKYQQGDFVTAEKLLRRSLEINDRQSDTCNNLGLTLVELGKYEEAIHFYKKAIKFKNNESDFHYNLGLALIKLKSFNDALRSFSLAIQFNPTLAKAYEDRGNTLRELNRNSEALKEYSLAIYLDNNNACYFHARGKLYLQFKNYSKALEDFDKSIELAPDVPQFIVAKGALFVELRRYDKSINLYLSAILKDEKYIEAIFDLANIYQTVGDYEKALTWIEKVIDINQSYPGALSNRANILRNLGRFQDAFLCFEKAIEINCDQEYLHGNWLEYKMHLCCWENFESELKTLVGLIKNSKKAASPFSVLALTDEPSVHKLTAESWVGDFYSRLESNNIINEKKSSKIHLGFYSADFRNHPVSILLIEMLELINKDEFEIFAFSFGPVTGDEMQIRLSDTFSKYFEVAQFSDLEISTLSKKMSIDIALDLSGYTAHCRPGIFAHRVAPLQVAYLGYPGTTGSNYIDYIIADEYVIPTPNQVNFTEKIAYLPNCFIPTNSDRKASSKKYLRSDMHLPDDAFVFCCFNASYKITPSVFNSWMVILSKVEDSVLWLSESNEICKVNLINEAIKSGVSSNRIIFASKIPSAEEHLARLRLADLFLDTFPYNAHATALDALISGIPVLTRTGESFASRVAGSMLNTIGTDYLITTTKDEYVAKAIYLANSKKELNYIKKSISDANLSSPLFDTKLQTRNIEKLFKIMHARNASQIPPDHIYLH
jgi:predicted O-linked N-acetylglucosamine transferase (SPINDLY family)